MTQNNCVVRCTAEGSIIDINPIELHHLIQDADKHINSMHGVGQRAAYYQRLATLCETSGNNGQAIGLLRKALALYCRHDIIDCTQHFGQAAKSCARHIDHLRRRAFGNDHSFSMLSDVITFYDELYWMCLLDEKPEVWDIYCAEGKIHKLDHNQWLLLVRQLTMDAVG